MIKEEKLRMCSNQKARLPDMSGIDVMKEIKDIAPSVLVIIVTAYGDEEVAVDALRATPAIILRSHSAEPIHGAERTSFPSPISRLSRERHLPPSPSVSIIRSSRQFVISMITTGPISVSTLLPRRPECPRPTFREYSERRWACPIKSISTAEESRRLRTFSAPTPGA